MNVGASTYNFVGTGTGNLVPNIHTTNVFSDDPKLGPLTNNGGPIRIWGDVILTHMPQCDSLAIDAGDPSAMAGTEPIPIYDQRGFVSQLVNFDRIVNFPDNFGGPIDIGSVGVQLEQPEDPCCNVVGDYNRNGVVDAADYPDGATISVRHTLCRMKIETRPPEWLQWKTTMSGKHTSARCATCLAEVLPLACPATTTATVTSIRMISTSGTKTSVRTTNLAADGNGNGIVDLADLAVWQDYEKVTTLSTIAGDFDGNGVVDMGDYSSSLTPSKKRRGNKTSA